MEDNQPKNNEKRNPADHLREFRWKKGQSGNLKGRPKGKSLKEYSRDYLASMTDEERMEFMEGLNKVDIWKMAERNPENKSDITLDNIQPILVEIIREKQDEKPEDNTNT